MGNDQDDLIMAPSTMIFYRLKAGQFIDMIHASAASAETMTDAQGEIERILSDAHRLGDGQDDDFTIRDQAELTETASAIAQTMTLLLASIAGVLLVVGGIAIMNIMLVSVTERMREIGVRMSVGARSRDVLQEFSLQSLSQWLSTRSRACQRQSLPR
jgi:putative ABC transport system permease protein